MAEIEGKRRRSLRERVEVQKRTDRGDALIYDNFPKTTRYKLWSKVANLVGTTRAQEWARAVEDSIGHSPLVSLSMSMPFSEYVWKYMSGCSGLDCLSAAEVGIYVYLDAQYSEIRRLDRKRDSVSIASVKSRIERDLKEVNGILADEFVGYRLHPDATQRVVLARIGDPVTQREIVDRTYRLMAGSEFDAVVRDYDEGWRAYSKGEFHDAVFKAGKAYESAMRVLLVKVDSTAKTDITANPLAQALIEKGVFPAKLQNFLPGVKQILMNGINSLRNDEGVGHGSTDLVGPEASAALLSLNLTGSLIVFLIQAYNAKL